MKRVTITHGRAVRRIGARLVSGHWARVEGASGDFKAFMPTLREAVQWVRDMYGGVAGGGR